VAQGVGKTSRQTCGACHFKGGGGEAVKHGDMDSSLTGKPNKAVDVHMAPRAQLQLLHLPHLHQPRPGGQPLPGDRQGRDGHQPAGPRRPDPACESCHGLTPHPRDVNDKLNDHVDKVACQTCHIPAFCPRRHRHQDVVGLVHRRADRGPRQALGREAGGLVVYDGMKGDFEWGENVVPEYYWFDGTVRYTLVGDHRPGRAPVEINRIQGGYDDPKARIWPFKVMRGQAALRHGQQHLVVGHLFGKDDAAYWKTYDWGKALRPAWRRPRPSARPTPTTAASTTSSRP
jgi:hypothetical protein